METVIDQIDQMHFEGNVIPSSWYKRITFANGKPNLNAITILADIIYWYRKTEIKDEDTGEVTERRKRIRSDKLQRSYSQLCSMFGFGKDQARDACDFLVEKKLITREFRTVNLNNGDRLGNVMFLEPIPENIKIITYREEKQTNKSTPVGLQSTTLSDSKPTGVGFKHDTNTGIISGVSTESVVSSKNDETTRDAQNSKEKKPETERLEKEAYDKKIEDHHASTLQAMANGISKQGSIQKWTDIPPDIMGIAETFMDEFKRPPTKSEKTFWIKGLRNLREMGLTSDDIRAGMARMKSEGLTIASPSSIAGVSWSIKSKRKAIQSAQDFGGKTTEEENAYHQKLREYIIQNNPAFGGVV
jgi:hypothetical protein